MNSGPTARIFTVLLSVKSARGQPALRCFLVHDPKEKMTLIVYVLTEEYMILASDRRVTTMQAGRPVKFEDSAMKSFLLNGQLMMGFTGIAELDGMPMEQWVAERLSGVAPNDIPFALRDGMAEYYDRHPAVKNVPHHFRAGFAFNPARNPSTFPIGYEVGNTDWVARGDRVACANVGSFRVTQNVFGNRKQAVGAVGAPYSLKALRSLEGMVRHARRAHPHDPYPLYAPIVGFIRSVAARSGGTVGNTVLVASIPRSAVPVNEPGWMLPVGEPSPGFARDHPAALMYAESADTPVIHLPALIYPHMQVIGFQLERGDDSPMAGSTPAG